MAGEQPTNPLGTGGEFQSGTRGKNHIESSEAAGQVHPWRPSVHTWTKPSRVPSTFKPSLILAVLGVGTR